MRKLLSERFSIFYLCMLILLTGFSVSAQTPDANGIVYVKSGATGDGSSWANATGNLQAAIDANGVKEVWVAAGTYIAPGTGSIGGFVMKNDVAIYGGFPDVGNPVMVDRNREANETILSGDDQRRVVFNNFTDDNKLTATAVLDGFTLTEGRSNIGGGMYNYYSSPTLRNLVIRGNTATTSGGGIYNSFSSPTLTNVVISENMANSNGGGIYSSSSSPILTNVTISRNTADSGGGMYNYYSSSTLTNLVISGNKADRDGGGINNQVCSPILTNVLISENTANRGGGIYNFFNTSSALTNVTIVGNTASYSGGGVHNYNSSPTLTNVTIAGNMASYSGGGMYNTISSSPKLFNSIVWGGIDFSYSRSYQAKHSLIEGNSDTQDGNIKDTGLRLADIFIDALAGNYSLKPGSLAVNAGNNSYYADADKGNGDLDADLDAAGKARLQGGTIDIGAFESAHEDISSLSGLTPISVAYGEELADIVFPTSVTATLTGSGVEMDLALDTDIDNWTLLSSSSAGLTSYDPAVAGVYTFGVPVVPADPALTPWFTNTQGLKAILEITVEKGTPSLAVGWGTVAIDPQLGLELIYGDVEVLDIDTDSDAVATFTFSTASPMLNVGDLTEVRAILAGSGTMTITLPETDNFEKVEISFPVQVAKKTLTFDGLVVIKSKAYDGTTSAEITDGTLKGVEAGDVVDVDVTALFDNKNTGEDKEITVTYALTGTAAHVENYNPPVDVVFNDGEIEKVSLQVTAGNVTKVYGDPDPVFKGEYIGFVFGEDESYLTGTLSLVRETGEHVGVYGIRPSGLNALNYEIGYLDGELEITPLPVTVTADAKTKVYGTADPTLTFVSYPAQGTLLPNGEVLSFTGELNRISGESVGDYAIQQNTLGNSNYTIAYSVEELKITQAVPNLSTLADIVKVYGDADFELVDPTSDSPGAFTYTSNKPNVATINGNRVTINGAGTAVITVTQAETQNYEGGSTTFGLTVDKAEAVITADAVQNHVYDGMVKNASAVLNHGETTLVYSPQQGYADAGTYSVTLSSEETDNYLATSKTVQLIIEQSDFRNLVLKDKTVTYNGKPYSLELESFPQEATVVYENNGHTDVGVYTVTMTISHPNLREKTMTATLTITKAQQQISFAEIGTVLRDASRVALNVRASSGLPVTVIGDDDLVATVSDEELLVHRLGTVRLTATQEGDRNHEAAAPVSIMVVVADEAEGPVKVSKVISPNGDGVNDFLILEGIKGFPDNRLQIFSRNGLVVFDLEGYDNDTKAFKGLSNTRVSIDTLPEGTYFYSLRFRDGNQWKTKKGWFVLKVKY